MIVEAIVTRAFQPFRSVAVFTHSAFLRELWNGPLRRLHDAGRCSDWQRWPYAHFENAEVRRLVIRLEGDSANKLAPSVK